SHRPSGEKAANELTVEVLRKNCGSPARIWPDPLSTGTVRISLRPGACSEKTSRVPSGVKEVGNCMALLWVRGCGLPAPSARVQPFGRANPVRECSASREVDLSKPEDWAARYLPQ